MGRTRAEQLADIEQQIRDDEERLKVLLQEKRGTSLAMPHETEVQSEGPRRRQSLQRC